MRTPLLELQGFCRIPKSEFGAPGRGTRSFPLLRSALHHSAKFMADARRARAERRAALAARVAQTAPVGGPPRCSPSPAANAATGPAGNEQQAFLLHPFVRRDGRTATPSLTPAGSSSHARRAPTDAQAVLLMARELLSYHAVDDFYEDWLDRIAELVSAAGGSPAPSLSLPRPPPVAGDVAHGAPPPPPQQDGTLALRRAP